MTKDQVASALREIGTILELQGENPFKCRAYLNGARTLETSATDLTELVRTNRLGELPGIGDALREKITTLITTGKLPYLEELRSSIPAGLLPLLDLPGLGPKKLRALRDKLKIESLEAKTAAWQPLKDSAKKLPPISSRLSTATPTIRNFTASAPHCPPPEPYLSI